MPEVDDDVQSVHCSLLPVSKSCPWICVVFEVSVDVLVTKDGEIKKCHGHTNP